MQTPGRRTQSRTPMFQIGRRMNSIGRNLSNISEETRIERPQTRILGKVISQESNPTVMLDVKDGLPIPVTPQGIKTILIHEANSKKVEWYFDEDSSNFDEFLQFAKQSFDLGNDSSVVVYQLENESDNKEDGMEIESNDDFVLCYDDLNDSDIIYMMIVGGSGSSSVARFDISIDFIFLLVSSLY